MDPLTSIGLVIWTLVSLGLTLNVLHPLINRDRARPLSLIFGFGLGWLIGELTIQWILLNAGIFWVEEVLPPSSDIPSPTDSAFDLPNTALC